MIPKYITQNPQPSAQNIHKVSGASSQYVNATMEVAGLMRTCCFENSSFCILSLLMTLYFWVLLIGFLVAIMLSTFCFVSQNSISINLSHAHTSIWSCFSKPEIQRVFATEQWIPGARYDNKVWMF